MSRRFAATLLLSLAVASTGYAQSLTDQQKLSDLNQLFTTIESSYGPLHYKAQAIGLNTKTLRSKYEALALQTKSNGEFYYLLKKMVAEFHDGHFGIYVPTTHVSQLPIMTDLVQGRVLIDTIDRNLLKESEFPYVRGDEIVSLNGVPMDKVLDELQSYIGSGYSLSERRSAAQAVFFRRGSWLPVPTGKVKIGVRRGTSDVIDTVELEWKESGTPLDERLPNPTLFDNRVSRNGFNMLSNRQSAELLLGRDRVERSYRCNGDTRIEIPKDATVIMRKPFVAYYHPTAKGNVGYLRIPDYFPRDESGVKEEYEKRFNQYQYAVKVLEENTVGLIIDQDHNCGGRVSYMENIVGLFMDKEYKPLQFRLLANKAEYISYIKDMDEWAPQFTMARVDTEKVAKLILDHWKAGDFMTPLTSIGGNEVYKPQPYHYTKPIVMLIDELAGSGGDAFPSMMQGFGRAKLLGTRTSGLGGHVEEIPPLQYSQMTMRITKSLFYRPDGVEVENNGAVPDIPYTITRDDFMYSYRGYQAFYLNELLKLVPDKQ